MLDLRQAAAELVANPLVPVPPIEGVVARARAYRAARRRRQVGAGVTLVALVVTAIARAGIGGIGHDTLRTVDKPVREEESSVTTTTVLPPPVDASGTFPTLPWSGQSFEGYWGNGANHQRSCSIVRYEGPPLEVLVTGYSDVIEDAVRSLNRLGGICGRLVNLVQGSAATRDLGRYVAVVGTPLDEDLDSHVARGRFAEAGVPLVVDGLNAVHHRAANVFPVGPSAGATTRTAVADAQGRGAKSFGIVYDAGRTFGREAAASFESFVRSRGGTVKASIGLNPRTAGYASESERFANACGVEGCDFVLLALLPDTAKTWLGTNPVKPRVQLAGLPTLLDDSFSDHCMATTATHCEGLVAWSGFVPRSPVESWNVEARHAYGSAGGSATREGAAVAARVLIAALDQAGPDATASSMRKALQELRFSSYITPELSWPLLAPKSQAWAYRSNGIVPESYMDLNQPADRIVGVTEAQLPAPGWYPLGTGWRSDPVQPG